MRRPSVWTVMAIAFAVLLVALYLAAQNGLFMQGNR